MIWRDKVIPTFEVLDWWGVGLTLLGADVRLKAVSLIEGRQFL